MKRLNKNILKVVIFCLFASLLGFRVWQVTGCLSFKSFVFDSKTVAANVQVNRLYQSNPDSLVSKAAHNKFTATPYEFLLNFSSLFDPRFLLDLIGPLGLIASVVAIYEIVSLKIKSGFVLLGLLLASCLSITLFTSSKTDMLILCSLWFLLTFYSLNFFSKNKVRLLAFVLLWCYSLWFFFISWQLSQICNEIFFK